MSRSIYMIVIVLAGLTGACASSGATPHPFPMPAAKAGSTTNPKAKGSAIAYSLTGTALGLRGTPYRNGGTDPNGFDCSGFVQYVFAQHGIVMPRKVTEQFHSGRDVQTSQLQAGDLVFFTTVAPGASHVGIALGGDEFVHAPSSTGQVRVERMSAAYWATRFVGARRVL
jgi:cell wall-associated NlpC family hydrolase